MAAPNFKDRSSSRPTRGAETNLKLSHFIQNAITDNLDDIECHADEWVLPTPSSTMLSQSRCSFTDRQFECKLPSPLIHDMCEETHLPTTHCLLPYSCKRRHSEEMSGGRSPYIPIRIRRHRRTDSEIMIRLTDSEFEFAPDSTVLVKTGTSIIF
jgi:hypothetical protein